MWYIQEAGANSNLIELVLHRRVGMLTLQPWLLLELNRCVHMIVYLPPLGRQTTSLLTCQIFAVYEVSGHTAFDYII